MIFSPVRAIAIDNNSLELISIVNGLSGRGIACSAHLYDAGELTPAPPKNGYRHLRLAFVDMNLLDAAGMEAKNVASIITTVFKQAISADCGPYCLIFWTSFPEKVDEFTPEVLRQFRQQGVPTPATITCLGKAEIIPVTNNSDAEEISIGLRSHFEAQAKLAEKLESSLAVALNKSGSAAVASAWETLLCEAASDTFSELYGQAKNVGHKDPGAAFADILSTIAVEAVGQKNAREEPLVGLTEGLLELVVDHLRSATSTATADEVVRTELFERIKNGTDPLPPTTIAEVNRLFQVELLDKNKLPKRTLRGLVLRPTAVFLQAAGLDEGWESFLWREVLHDPARLKGDDPRKVGFLARKAEITAKVRPLLIEVGADCDHAQRKPRSHRFLLAAEIPEDCAVDYLKSSDTNRRSPYVSDAIEVMGPWPFSESLASVAVCCKRFLSRQTDDVPADCEVVMRVRSAIVNHLLHRYSTLATRPGFVSLRSAG